MLGRGNRLGSPSSAAYDLGREDGVACGPAVGGDHAPVGEQLAGVLEDDDAVAEQAPALFWKAGQSPRGVAIHRFSGGTDRLVLAHRGLRTMGVLCHGSHDQ